MQTVAKWNNFEKLSNERLKQFKANILQLIIISVHVGTWSIYNLCQGQGRALD